MNETDVQIAISCVVTGGCIFMVLGALAWSTLRYFEQLIKRRQK